MAVCSSMSHVAVVLLSIVQVISCDIKCRELFVTPSNYEACCIEAKIDSNTIKPNFTVTPFVNGTWRLDANISWDRPEGIYFDAYAVDLDYTTTISTANSCHDEYLNYMITETEWIYLRNIPFGYTPYFIVYTAKQISQLINQEPNDNKNIEFLDCYESTQSIAFCQTQDVQVAGKPIGLMVVSIMAEDQRDGSPRTATVNVSWNPPVHINSKAVLNGFGVLLFKSGQVQATATVPVPESQRSYTDPFSLSFSHIFEGVEINYTNESLFKVYAKVDNVECSHSSCMTGNMASLPIDFSSIRPNGSVPLEIVVGSVVSALVLATCFLIMFYFGCRRFCRQRRRPPDDDGVNFIISHQESNFMDTPIPKAAPKECFAGTEIDRNLLSEISKISEIGKGSFGVVYKGFAFGSVNRKLGYYPVAVKSLKENATSDMKSSFLEEIALMVEIGSHHNILSVLGCCTVDEPYYLITEFMIYGDLLHFLWKTRDNKIVEEDSIYHLTELNQLQIATQIARGMEYISMTRFYHGDLAARNILVGRNLIVKISDFGLADDIYERGYKQNNTKVRPVKWASLETNTTGRYSIASDVWSFGIVLHEIFTRGEVPYPEFNNMELLVQLREGYRMEQPRDCPAEVYKIMQKCWQEKPSNRPTFTNLFESLDKMIENNSDYMRFDSSENSANGIPDTPNRDYPNKRQTSNDSGRWTGQPRSGVSAQDSGQPDELQLWLHMNGPIPEGAKTVDFVPMKNEEEDSVQSDSHKHTAANVEKNVYERDRDCDILTV